MNYLQENLALQLRMKLIFHAIEVWFGH